MKIREAFKKAMDLTTTETVESEGKKFVVGGTLPLPVPYCFKALALILYVDALMRSGEKPDEKVLKTLNNDDITSINSLSQYLKLSGFLKWWFEQEAKIADFDSEGGDFWWDTSEIINSWNQYAEIMDKGDV